MKVARILRVSEQGVSRPYVCEDEAGRLRWCKGNHTGIRAVICEWICARLAVRLELPVPEPAILRLDTDNFESWRVKRNSEVPTLVTAVNPYVFGSLNVNNVKDVFKPEIELAHINENRLAEIYMFDRLVRNTDRTYANSNLLVNGSVYIIDHNNAFDPAFDPQVFADEHILREYYRRSSERVRSDFQALVAERITGRFIDEIWSEMPEAWADVGAELLPPAEIKAMLEDFTL